MSLYLQQLEKDYSHFEYFLPQHYQPLAGGMLAQILSAMGACQDEAESAIALLSLDVNDIVDMPDYMQRIGALYILWREKDSLNISKVPDEENNPSPALSCLMAAMLSFLDIPADDKYARAAMAGAFMADLPNDNAFHGNAHYRDITATVFRILTSFLQLHRKQAELARDFPVLSQKNQALLLCAATIHDFCHDGKGNIEDGQHKPMRLEQKAYENAAPILSELGLSDADLHDLHLMVLATDVSYGPQALSPSRILTHCYGHLFEGKDKPVVKAEDYKFLADNFLERKDLTLLAMMLEEADLFCSVGLSYDYAKMTTILVAEETQILSTKASTLHGFIEMICNGIMATPSARKLFKPTFEEIYKIASDDVRLDKDYAIH